jgi:hypothetical protein
MARRRAQAGRHAAAAQARTRPQPLLALLAFGAPLMIWAEIVLVGRLFVTELILAGALPLLLLTRGRMLAAPMVRTFLILAFIWLLSQVMTDLIRGTPFVDYSRGWSKIIFMMVNFAAIYMIVYGSRLRIVLFAVGLAFGGYLTFLINPAELAVAQPWKFGIGASTTILVTIAGMWRPLAGYGFLPVGALGAMGAIGLYIGSRSLAGVTILSALYILLQRVLARRNAVPARFSPVRTLLFLFFGLLVTSVFLNVYQSFAEQGLLGDFAREIYERQSSGAFGVLLGGRSEIFVSTQAILDSPLLGHGSWAKDPQYSAMLLELEKYGYEINNLAAENDLIPTHSHLFGAWVEAGFLGAVFWMWVLFLAFRVMSNLYLVREPLSPLITFIGFMLIWDILFSPFGADRRVTTSYNVVLLMFAWDTLRASVPEEALMRFRKLARRRRTDVIPLRPGDVRRPLPTRPRR